MKTKFKGILTLLLAFVVQITFAQEQTVSGTVVDENNLPLPSATVLIKGTTTGTSTDFDGKYSIKANNGDVLEFSFVGYATQSITVSNNSINVTMQPDNELDEVVVAFRKQKKEAITGSVDQIDTEILTKNTAVANVDQLLQGNVTGVTATATGGNPGARSQVFIRGIASETGLGEPYYFIDGVRVTAGDFKSLNPSDIADVSVLKDPSSLALYGARGGNGVILITTKRGSGDGVIEFESSVGYNQLTTNNFDMMNANEYMRYRNILTPGSFSDQQIAETPNTDWQDLFFRNPITLRNQLSFSGSTDKMKYFISGSHYKQEGILERSKLERSTFRTNISGNVKDWLEIGTNLSLGYSEENLADDFGVNTNSPVTQAYLNLPTSPAFNPDGSINNNQTFGFNALEQTRLNRDKGKQFKLVGGVYAKVNLFKNLIYDLQLGIDYRTNYRNRFFKPGTNLGDQANNGNLLITDNANATFTHTSKLSYEFKLGENHTFQPLAGVQFERIRLRDIDLDVQNFEFPQLSSPDNGTDKVNIEGEEDNATFLNYFFNLDYNFKNKYFFTGSISNSTDSRFAESVRSDIFYSLGASWVASKEQFLSNVSWLDNLKFRIGWGLTGNNNTGTFYDSQTFYPTGQYVGSTSILTPSRYRKNVGWEKTWGTNFGIDFRFLDRIYGSIDLYNQTIEQLIFEQPLAPSTGGSVLVQNVDGDDVSITNKGYEIQLAVDVLRKDDYGITLGGNFSYNKNEVDYNLDGQTGIEDTNRSNAWFGDGHALGTWYLVRFAGVNPANGEPLWYDANGNITNVYDEDQNSVVLEGKSQYAPINGGFFGTFRYKAFELDARFSFQKDKWISNNTRFFTENTNFGFNQSTAMLNIWQQPGDITEIPRAGSGSQFDSHLLEDASFLRLKSLTLSYNLPSKYTDALKLKGLRIYVQGQNLLTWTKYRGLDPETTARFDGFSYPVARTFLAGVNIKL